MVITSFGDGEVLLKIVLGHDASITNGIFRVKVIHVFSSLGFGGVETHAVTIARFSSAYEIKPIFCAIHRGGAAANKIEQLGCQVTVMGTKPNIPSIHSFIKLLLFFIKERPDVVHTHGAEANFHGILAGLVARVPIRVGEEIGIPTHSRLAKFIFKILYAASSCVIAISESVKNWLIESGEVSRRKVTRIYNPVDIEDINLYLDSPDAQEKFRIAFVGRLEPVKNPLSLIIAVSLLKKRGVPIELCVVGDGGLMSECRALCSTLRLSDSVKLFGYLEEPFSVIKGCNLYVQPSITEGFGIALVEAMMCRIPVLATSVGGAPEIINHGVNGWLTDETDADSLASLIFDIWLIRDRLPCFGLAAYESVCGRFHPSTYIDDLNSLYLTLRK